MLLIALVVRSTTQKEESLSTSAECTVLLRQELRDLEWLLLSLDGTDKMIIVAIEGIVAHGPGGNQGKFLVL
jgi:hypothetical protein